MILLLPFICMIILLLLGIPIAFSIAGVGILGILLVTGDLNMLLNILGVIPYTTVATYILTTIPMFIFMAYLASEGGLADGIFKAAGDWIGHVRGGLAIGTCVAAGVFGAMSGVSLAGATVMSQVALPEMRRVGYSDILSAGVVGIGTTTNLLIPPSVALVVYGVATETSIGKLLLAGLVPGIMVLFFLAIIIFIWTLIRPQDSPSAPKATWSERWRSLLGVWPSLVLILIVLALLYTGICTPTEVGAIGAFFAGLVGVFFGRLNWNGFIKAAKATISASAMIFMILIGTYIFSYFMTLSEVPQRIIASVGVMEINPWVIIAGIAIGYFVMSMFMDELPLLLITLQLTFPLVISLGFDAIWFGIFTMLLVMMGLIFPPVGIVCFIISSISKIELHRVFVGTGILMTAVVITLIVLCLWPEIVLWLPAAM